MLKTYDSTVYCRPLVLEGLQLFLSSQTIYTNTPFWKTFFLLFVIFFTPEYEKNSMVTKMHALSQNCLVNNINQQQRF